MSTYPDPTQFNEVLSFPKNSLPHLAYCKGITKKGEILFCWKQVSFSKEENEYTILDDYDCSHFSNFYIERIFEFPKL